MARASALRFQFDGWAALWCAQIFDKSNIRDNRK
jgi:hypothetical protein